MVPVFVPGPSWSSTSGDGVNGIGSTTAARIGTAIFPGFGTVLWKWMEALTALPLIYSCFFCFFIDQCAVDKGKWKNRDMFEMNVNISGYIPDDASWHIHRMYLSSHLILWRCDLFFSISDLMSLIICSLFYLDLAVTLKTISFSLSALILITGALESSVAKSN